MANEGFSAPIDWFNMGGTNMDITGSADGRSNQVAEAFNADGDIAARDIWGDKFAPSAEYVLKKAMTALTALGTITSVTVNGATKKVMLTSLSVSTSFGSVPTISANGVQVEDGATTRRNYAIGNISLAARAKAQDILDAITASNADLNSASFTFSINPVVAETAANGICANDCNQGKIEGQFTYVQTGATAATFTAKSGYTITALPTATRNDGSYIEWSVSITKDLTGTDTPPAN